MRVLITGGAGFIGVNCAHHFAATGHEVVVFDDLSRSGAQKNLRWLQNSHPIRFVKGDVRAMSDVESLFKIQGPFDTIIHLAGQVAVTSSIENPLHDFSTNALGTLHCLECARRYCPETVFLYSSTNKVYGSLPRREVRELPRRFVLVDLPHGVDESEPLDFHSPYGCSKGSADQYCHDYARVYNMHTAILRQSCIYGYRQFGIEDQGWVAWFCIAAVLGRPLTIYGNGKQVRDVLFIDDLVALYEKLSCAPKKPQGLVLNIGGGERNTLSLLELIDMLERISGQRFSIDYKPWRSGDQRVFVADVSRAEKLANWKPAISCEDGVRKLYSWVEENRSLF
jgi:CDP-paratose 2-epimerase